MQKKYMLPTAMFIIGTTVLVGILIAIQVLGKENHLEFVYGIIPSIPGMVILLTALVGFRKVDERLQFILTHAVLLGFFTAMCAMFGLGLMQVYAGWPAMNAAIYSTIMSVCFALGYLISNRKYS